MRSKAHCRDRPPLLGLRRRAGYESVSSARGVTSRQGTATENITAPCDGYCRRGPQMLRSRDSAVIVPPLPSSCGRCTDDPAHGSPAHPPRSREIRPRARQGARGEEQEVRGGTDDRGFGARAERKTGKRACPRDHPRTGDRRRRRTPGCAGDSWALGCRGRESNPHEPKPAGF